MNDLFVMRLQFFQGDDWCESKALVWFDHERIAWRAYPCHDRDVDDKFNRELFGSFGYDPLDAVDQLVGEDQQLVNLMPKIGPFNWDNRIPKETDKERGYGPYFPVNPYSYKLEPTYEATVVKLGRGWIAYLEKDDGQVFIGAADSPNLAVAMMETDMHKGPPLKRLPGTNITLPMDVAEQLGVLQ